MTRPRVRPATATALLLLATACVAPEPTAGASDGAGPVRVVASTDVYGSIVGQIGGEAVSVTSLIDDSTADPLEHEATPADAAAVAGAQLVVVNGGGYDAFMTGLADEVDRVLDVSELSAQETAAEPNEHVWYDLETVRALATAVADELARVRPADAQRFEDGAAALTAELDALAARLDAVAAAHGGTRVAATEPLAEYLLADAGLVDVAPTAFQEAVEEGTDPPAAVLQEVLGLFDPPSVEVLVLNTQTQSAVTDQVVRAAETAGVPVVAMSETLTRPGYAAWLGAQVDALEAALRA